MYFIKRLAHFIPIQYTDYFTYNLTDLLLTRGSRIRYTTTVFILFTYHLKLTTKQDSLFCKDRKNLRVRAVSDW